MFRIAHEIVFPHSFEQSDGATEFTKMIEVKTIDLTQRGVTLPSGRVGMVVAQPFLSLTLDEP